LPQMPRGMDLLLCLRKNSCKNLHRDVGGSIKLPASLKLSVAAGGAPN
jgi:hypothetical protein